MNFTPEETAAITAKADAAADERLRALRERHPTTLPSMSDNIATMMRLAAEHKASASAAKAKRDELRLALEAQESEVARLSKQASDFYAGADGLREFLRNEIGASVNPWFEEAEVCFRPLSKLYGYKLIDVPMKGPSHEIEVIHIDGEKIATIVCVKPTSEDKVMFTVAGWRTGNGSPPLPFDNMVDAAVAVGELTRWDPTGDSQLKDFQFDGAAHKLDALGNENREPKVSYVEIDGLFYERDGNGVIAAGPAHAQVPFGGFEYKPAPAGGEIISVVTISVDPALEKLIPGTLARSVANMALRL